MAVPTLIRIFDAAYQLMGEMGYEKMSMNAIAKGAGITKPSLYYYFKSKEELVLGLLEEIGKTIDIGRHYNLIEWTPDNYGVRFRALGRAMIEEYRTDMLFSKVMKQFGILSLTNEAVAEKFADIHIAQQDHFEKILRHGIACGVVDGAKLESCIDFLVMTIRTISEEIPVYPDKNYSEIWGLGIKAVTSRRLGY
jgi:AcrR family transcriptional regulator